ncbi:MAG TPA: LamG-like jellyroll fold domain-containing protein [Verrucomicrobiae bacterium]|nr:LamG-like jellyroll fold domain-containing protein [Verrucomicrobiae bacterium]
MKIQYLTHHHCGRFLAIIALALTVAFNARADYQSTVLGDTPVAYYPLNIDVDPGITATDVSGNGNNGTYNGTDPAVATVPGPSPFIPNALLFDGFTSFVDLGTGSNPALLNFSNQITMEAWAQPVSTSVGSGPAADVIGKGYDGNFEMALRAQGGNYYGGLYNGNTFAASGGVQTTNWTYLVSTYDGTNWNLYVNGVLVQANPAAVGAVSFSTPWAIGRGSPNGNDRWFAGNICQVALYTNALTAAQVLNHFFVGELGTSSASSVPIIIAQPQPQTAVFGGTATFNVGVVSALSTTNQWFKNNVAMAGQTNATLTITNAGAGDAVNYRVVVGNSNGTTNSVSVSLTVLAANSLKWNSGGTSGVWDTGSTADWLNLSNSTQTVFSNFDQVLFDDTVGVSNNVTVSGTVSPSLITVNSSVNNYTISSGTINGSGGLVKKGSSTLNIFNSGTLTGPVTISGGVIYAGNNTFSSVASITITNNATLDLGGGTLGGNKPIIVSGSGVNGEGAIINSYNDYPGQLVNIALAGDTVFGSFARWDLAGGSQISGPHFLTLDWSGNTGSTGGDGNTYGEWTSVTIGANVAGITLTNGSKLGSHSMETAFQNPGTVTTVQTNSQLIFWNGGWNGTIHLLNGGQSYQFGAPGAFNGSTVVMENGAQWYAYGGGGDQSINVAITLNGVAHFLIGDNNRTYTNLISGAGGFVSDAYNHAMIFSASNTYSGPTIIGSSGNTPVVALANNGSISHSSLIFFGGNDPTVVHMDVSGRSDQTLTLASGQTLGGIGTINGSLAVASGAALSPAGTNTTIGITTGTNATGTISATGVVALHGTTTLKLNGSGVNDQVQAGTSVTYGGTLNLVNVSGAPLANGNSFQVFSAASYSGSFTSITPATPGAGLAWDTSQLNTFGFINVVSSTGSGPVIGSTTVSGGNLIFSGTGGTANGSYAVLTATNIATPLINWTSLVTNSFNGVGAFSVTNAILPGTPQRFYSIKQLP